MNHNIFDLIPLYDLIQFMSAKPETIVEQNLENNKVQYLNKHNLKSTSKVNLNDLVERLKKEKKEEQKNNLIISAAAISAVAVFGIILVI